MGFTWSSTLGLSQWDGKMLPKRIPFCASLGTQTLSLALTLSAEVWVLCSRQPVFTIALGFLREINQIKVCFFSFFLSFDPVIKVESWTPNCTGSPMLCWSHTSLVSVLFMNALHQLITVWHSIKFNHWTPKGCNVSTYSMVPFGWKFSISFKDYYSPAFLLQNKRLLFTWLLCYFRVQQKMIILSPRCWGPCEHGDLLSPCFASPWVTTEQKSCLHAGA